MRRLVTWLRSRFSRRPATGLHALARRLENEPAYGRGVSEYIEQRNRLTQEAEAASAPPDNLLLKLVDDLLDPSELKHRVAEILLAKAGKRAERELIDALRSARCRWPDPNAAGRESGDRVVSLLRRMESTQLSGAVAHLVDHPNGHVHSMAIEAVVATGTPEAARLAIRKLGVGSVAETSAKDGVAAALSRGTATPEFKRALLDWARDRSLNPADKPNGWAVEFFADHGGPQALEGLRAPNVLSLENNLTIHFALMSLNRHGVPVDAKFLRRAIQKAKGCGEDDWPWVWVFEPALEALDRHDHEAALRIAEEALDSSSKPQVRAAMKFVRKTASLPDWWASPPEGFVLSPEERRFLDRLELISECKGQVGNGGLSQYFFNSSGDQWPQTVEAFRVLGLAEWADALSKAANLFSPGGASTDRNRRIKRTAKMSAAEVDALSSLDHIFWGERLEVQLLRLMLEHKALFQRIRAAPRAAGLDTD